jgi:hypothetical protein
MSSAPQQTPRLLRLLPAIAVALALGSPAFAAKPAFSVNLDNVSPATITVSAGRPSPRLGGDYFSAALGGGRVSLAQGPALGKNGSGGLQMLVIEPLDRFAIVTCAIDRIDGIAPFSLTAAQLTGTKITFDISLPAGRVLDVHLEFAPNGPDNQPFWANNAPFSNRLVLGRIRGEGNFRTISYVVNEQNNPTLARFVEFVRSTASPDFRVRLAWTLSDLPSWEPDTGIRLDNITVELP